MPRRRILILEDDTAMRDVLAEALRAEGHHVMTLSNGTDAFVSLRRTLAGGGRPPDVLVTDLRMPGASGLETVEMLREIGCETYVLLVTAFGSDEARAAAERLGVLEVFDKPFDPAELARAIDRIDFDA